MYARLDIHKLQNKGESFYQPLMGNIVKELEKSSKFINFNVV